MFAAQLRHKISIQKRSSTLDSYGQQPDTWTEVAAVRADIRPARRSDERLAGKQMGTGLTHTIAVRYQAALTPPLETSAWRIVFDGRIIGIVSGRILNEASRWIVFDCIEGSLDGS